MALLLQKNELNKEKYLSEKPKLDYPDSVISFFKGHMGIPYGGFNDEVREMVLGPNPPEPKSPDVPEGDSLEKARKELKEVLNRDATDQEVLSYRLYPKVWMDFIKHEQEYGGVEKVPTEIFFYGLEANNEVEIELEAGKTLYISLSGMTDPDDQGVRRLFYQLNGFPRALEIVDENFGTETTKREKADPLIPGHVPSPMPGKILEMKVQVGDSVSKGDPITVLEAMKMEYVVTAKVGGKVEQVLVSKGEQVEEADLLASIN